MDYIINLILTLVVAGGLCGIVQVVHTRFKMQWIWTITVLSAVYFVITCFKTCRSECSFDCSSIQSLNANVNIKKEQQEDEVKTLEFKTKNIDNPDSLFSIKEKMRTIKYDKIAVYEMLDISLKELSKNCDGCKTSKLKYDSLLNKFNTINEK